MTSEEITRRIRALNGTLRELRKTYAHEPGYSRRDILVVEIGKIVAIVESLGPAFDSSAVDRAAAGKGP